MATTVITTWGRLTHSSLDPATDIANYVGDFADDFDLEQAEEAWREAINAALPEGVTLVGEEFIGQYGVEYDVSEFHAAIEGTDLDSILQAADKTEQEA